MFEFDVEVVFDVANERELGVHFEHLLPEIREGLEPVLASLSQRLLGIVQPAEPHRTDLLAEATYAFTRMAAEKLGGGVSIGPEPSGGGSGKHNVKAGALEYGAHSNVEVSAYTRADGTEVSAYHRHANIEAMRFLRNAIDQMRAEAESEIAAALQKILASHR